MKMLGDLLPSAIGRTEVLRAARAQSLFRRWEDVVGPQLAQNTKPDRFDQGVLWVATTGSAWSQELVLQKQVVLDRLNQFAGEDLFEDLKCSRPMKKARPVAVEAE